MTQVSRTTFKSITASDFPNNTTGLISPADLRGQLDNIADSSPFMVTNRIIPPGINDDSAGTGGNGAFNEGDIWIDELNDNSYICLDAAPAAAQWFLISGVNSVRRVGTTNANEIAVWTADGIVDGNNTFTWNGLVFALTGNISVTGNIIVTGTVDGRDIAADGTKLDGIESGAEVNLTGAEIVTAIDTELGSSDWQIGSIAIEDETVEILAAATRLNFAGAGVTVTDAGSGEALITIAGAGGGDVFKVGVPVNNQISVWTGDGTLEGDANLTWDGSDLTIIGDVSVEGYITALQQQIPITDTYRRVRLDESGACFEMDNAAANTIELIGEQDYEILGATQANPVVITSFDTDRLETGDTVVISGVLGMTELNGNTYRITVINGTTFSLQDSVTGVDIDGTGFGAFVAPTFPDPNGIAQRQLLDYPTGFYFEVIQKGNGATTLRAGANVQLNGMISIPSGVSGTITARYDVIRVRKMTTGGWIVDGDIGAIS